MKRLLSICFYSFCLAFAAYANENPSPLSIKPPLQDMDVKNHILYLMHTGNTAQALRAYETYRKEMGSHDFELMEQIGLILLDQGFRSRDPETQALTLFGAGISANEKAFYIIEECALSDQPELQLIAINFLARSHNDRADQILQKAMTSDFAIIRLEASLKLADKKHPRAVEHIEALMAKIPEEAWPVFPQLYASAGTPQAKKILRKLLTHPNQEVRVAAVISIGENGHDDLLPAIRRLASHHETAQQEACAAVLGVFKDESSVPRLNQLAASPNNHVRLAALAALYRLGRIDTREQVEALAKQNNLFAIHLLGTMPGSEQTLVPLLKSNNAHIRFNAAHALLELRDKRCLSTIAQVLLTDARDLAITLLSSPGKSLSSLHLVPSARQHFEDNPLAHELSLHIKEQILVKAVELPENDFIQLVAAIFDTQQNDLVPVAIAALENHATPSAVALLKKYQQKVGAPLIRNYCNLALYRLKEPGPYGDNLREWVAQQRNIDLIRFRPVIPWSTQELPPTPFELTPQESSRLLVDAFESFVSTQDDKGIDLLISVIQSGNQKNKYALIGLLMRAIQ